MSISPESRKVLVAFTEAWRKIPTAFRVGLVESFETMERQTMALPAYDEVVRETEKLKAQKVELESAIAARTVQAAEDAARQLAVTATAQGIADAKHAAMNLALAAQERRLADADAHIAESDRRKAEERQHAEAVLKGAAR